MEQIKVVISFDGQISYEVKGVRGRSCRELTKAIDALSGAVLESKNTREYVDAGAVNHLTTRG